jgi:hypothetical protein
MTAIQGLVVIGGSLVFITAMIVVMGRINERERRYMQRRSAEWIAGGRIPEEEPNFFSGSGGGSS